MPPRESLLTVQDVSKAYGPVTVLDDVSFTLRPGTVTVLSGPNGAGKSTLLRCLAGTARHRGQAHVRGVALDGSPTAQALLAYVPQRVDLPEVATVGEVLALFARLRRTTAVADVPDGFLPAADRRIGALSGGQRQRVVLAAATLGDPALLLLDEPAASLDNAGRAALWALVHARTQAGAAALVASPSPAELGAVADSELALDAGRVVHHGPWRGLHAIARAEEVGA
jgi:ABC-type multidrug transport system ATPase subunit